MTLTRKAPLKSTPMRPAISPEGRELLQARSGGWCEARLPGCLGQATDACHRRRREEWREEQLSDYWHGCRMCHRWTHDRVAEARDFGLILKLHQDPTVEPMAYQNAGWVLLDDDGGVWPLLDHEVAARELPALADVPEVVA